VNLSLPLNRAPRDMRILQPFGANPEAYARFGLNGHNGIDLETVPAELVVAVDDGVVAELRLDPSGYGMTVKLVHSWGESRYARGQKYSTAVDFELGYRVHRGERIFLSEVDGDHIHFGLRLRKDDGSLDYSSANGCGGYVDPLPHLRAALHLPPEMPAPAGKAKRA